MTGPKPSFSVKVDATNPGQFFACCGLLELAHRLWPAAEGWFDSPGPTFSIHSSDDTATLARLINGLRDCKIAGLSDDQRREREELEAEKRRLEKDGEELPKEKDDRRRALGTLARKGELFLGPPFSLALNWWQTGDEDATTVKTWAGQQELHKVARAAQDSLQGITQFESLLEFACVMRVPHEYQKHKADRDNAVEPFCFDARRFVHALDTGFSIDVQSAETAAHPTVELLSLIGLQRFRPAPTSTKWSFEYCTWCQPMPVSVGAAVVSGAVPSHGGRHYRFRLLFRDDQRRYKAFSYATVIGDQT